MPFLKLSSAVQARVLFYPAGADTARVQHYFDGGFTYSITNDIQWDIRGGKGLNAVADDYFAGTGLVLRFH